MLRNKLPVIFALILLIVISLASACDDESVDNIAPKTPDYTLKVIDERGNVHSDLLTLRGPGIKVDDKKITILAEGKQRQYTVLVKRKNTWYKADAEGKFELMPGSNELGIWVFDLERSDQEPLDKVWIRVFDKSSTPPAATIEPSVLEGNTDEFYTFTAKPKTEPVIGSYEWKLDGKLLGAGGGATFTKKFPEAGTHKLTVIIYDKFFKESCGEGEATVTIRSKQSFAP